MIPFEEAKSKVLEKAIPLTPKNIPLAESLGLVLADNVHAPIDLPPFTNSAMDGFALAYKDLVKTEGLAFPVSQTIKAGDSPLPLKDGTCAKIMTGASIPKGADAVIPIEESLTEDDIVHFLSPPTKGCHIRYAGEDIARGTVVAKALTPITTRVIALLSALGIARVSIYPRPHISTITTGSELVRPGEKLPNGAIFDSNGPTITAALGGLSINTTSVHVKDDTATTLQEIHNALESSDVIITIGGVSVGDFDYVRKCFEEMGIQTIFWRVAIKPGKPIFFGTLEKKLIFGLPGNPVSCLVTFNQFVRPAILKMMGHKKVNHVRKKARAIEAIKGSAGKTDFLRGIYEVEGANITVKLAGQQGSAMLLSLASSNCLIILPEEKSFIGVGEEVEIEYYDALG